MRSRENIQDYFLVSGSNIRPYPVLVPTINGTKAGGYCQFKLTCRGELSENMSRYGRLYFVPSDIKAGGEF